MSEIVRALKTKRDSEELRRRLDAKKTSSLITTNPLKNITPGVPDWRNITNVPDLYIKNMGDELPEANEDKRGELFLRFGGENKSDTFWVCLKTGDNVFEWVRLDMPKLVERKITSFMKLVQGSTSVSGKNVFSYSRKIVSNITKDTTVILASYVNKVQSSTTTE